MFGTLNKVVFVAEKVIILFYFLEKKNHQHVSVHFSFNMLGHFLSLRLNLFFLNLYKKS